jgi:hypothetical protein
MCDGIASFYLPSGPPYFPSMSTSNLGSDSPEGIKTGDWFALGDVNQAVVPLSLPPPPVAGPTRLRRALVRTIGFLLIAFTVFCVVRMARSPAARRAMLRWGSFGHERVASP